MTDLKKSVILITYCGVIPFYFTPLIKNLFHSSSSIDTLDIDNISSLYTGLIISFLSGMQWQKMIFKNKKKLLFIPLIPLFLVLISDHYLFRLFTTFILIFSLFFSLIIDLMILKNYHESWFKKLRVNATILASLSFLI